MRVISLDQSSIRTGVAVFDNSNLIHHGVIDLHKEKDADLRTKEMCKEIRQLVKKYCPNCIVLEDVNLRNGSVRTVIMLARLSGNIQEMGFEANIPIVFYSPSTWRRIAGIKMGREIKREQLKQAAIDMVYTTYGFKCGDDEAEAIIEGLAYLKENNLLPDLTDLKRSSKKNEENFNGKTTE